MTAQLNGITSQGKVIYELLLKNDKLTAKEIGKQLHILPHAVYRSIKPLISFGLVKQLETYPIAFQAQPVNQAIETYMLYARNNFLETFLANGIIKTYSDNQSLDMSFIKNRCDLLDRSNEDIQNAKTEVHHIVSGLELPSDTILELKNAVSRGISIKFIVQRLDEVSISMLKNWQKMGMEIKYFPLLEARIIIIDGKIVYITSYNPNSKEEAIGVRFNYAPIARLMNELFLQRWGLGKKII